MSQIARDAPIEGSSFFISERRKEERERERERELETTDLNRLVKTLRSSVTVLECARSLETPLYRGLFLISEEEKEERERYGDDHGS